MCKNKNGIASAFAVLSGIILVAAAVGAAVYFVLQFIERKKCCDYIECDCCCDDDDDDDDFDYDEYQEADSAPEAEPETPDAE